MIKKLFDPNGLEKIRFSKNATAQIKEWLAQNESDYDQALQCAKEVDDPVFGKALEFPCVIIDEVND